MCTRLRDKRKNVDAIYRRFDGGRPGSRGFGSNESLNVGKKQLIYAIDTTTGYNVEKESCFQDQYEFFVARTSLLEAVSTPVPWVFPGSVLQEASDTATDIGNFRSTTERPLETKAV